MKAFLMARGRTFALDGKAAEKLPPNADLLLQDLELGLLLQAMAQGDEFVLQVARQAILAGTRNDIPTIRYRQAVLKDCLAHPAIVKELYAIAVEAIARERKVHFGLYSKSPEMVLRRACEVLGMFVELLRRLRQVSARAAGQFQAAAFQEMFGAIDQELGEEYLAQVEAHLRELELREGVLISAELGTGNKGVSYTLRKPAHAGCAGAAGSLGAKVKSTASRLPSETRAARVPCGSCGTEGSTWRRTRWRRRLTISWAFSRGCERNWRSTLAA